MNAVRGGVGSLTISEDDVMSTTLNLFKPVEREISLRGARTVEIKPLSVESPGPFTFILPTKGNSYLDLAKTRLFLELQVKKADDSALASTDDMGICNMFAQSLFESITVQIDGAEKTFLGTQNFNYKNFIEMSLSYGKEAKETHLTSGIWVDDTTGAFEKRTSDNPGFMTRKGILPKKFQCFVPLGSDFLSCERLFPPGHTIDLTLIRAPDKFSLMGINTVDAKIVINKIALHVKYVDIHPDIHRAQMTMLQRKPMIFPFTKTEMKYHTVPSGITKIEINNIYNGDIPKTVLVAFVNTLAFTGDQTLNPFHFQTFGLTYAVAKVNDINIPTNPYKPNLNSATKLFSRLYRDFFDSIGILHDNTGNGHVIYL